MVGGEDQRHQDPAGSRAEGVRSLGTFCPCKEQISLPAEEQWKGLSKEGGRKGFTLGVQHFVLCSGLIWEPVT